MWAPWKVALVTGTMAGCASALAQLDVGLLRILSGAPMVAGLMSLLTWFGLWISKRPNLSLVPALSVACASAVAAFFLSLPIETHVELVDLPATKGHRPYSMPSAYVVSAVAVVLPAIIAFVAGRAFGVPPNTSLERTRDR
jgi:hypothetical protein